jgi:DNA-binding TFAR19-related protein (PDSD5 family)
VTSQDRDGPEDPDIAIIKARKLKELWKHAAMEKSKAARREHEKKPITKTDKEIVSDYLYDRGGEVLSLAMTQFPTQTRIIIKRIADLIRLGEIQQRISGGELLALFRSIGINVRINTTIKIEDHGKLVSFSEKLKEQTQSTMSKEEPPE